MAGVAKPAAVLLSEADDVATVFFDVAAGQKIRLHLSISGKSAGGITAREPIPSGHKTARRRKAAGELIYKYGQPIGRATAEIQAGDHVHTHNLASLLTGKPVPAAKKIIRESEQIEKIILSLAEAAGASREAAENFANALTEAHLRGVETHGIRRLRPYLDRMRTGSVDPKADPLVERNGAILIVDGKNGIGHHVAAVAADAASKAAEEHGVAVAIIRNSNHFGFAGYYAVRIAGNGQIGVAISNGQVCVAPVGGKRPVFSNNPIAVAAPVGKDRFFEFDMATSVTSRANIAQAAERGLSIAAGLALDAEGRETQDPHEALKGSLLPFGGEKGFAFLFAMEVLTGVFPGGAFADQVSSKEARPDAPERLSQFILAIDIERAGGTKGFEKRMRELIRRIGSSPVETPRYPGKRRWELRRKRLKEGIPLTESEDRDLAELSKAYGIELESGSEGRGA